MYYSSKTKQAKFVSLPNGMDLTKSNPLPEVVHHLHH